MKVFLEEQKFTQTWLILLILFGLLVPIGVMTNEMMKENSNMSITEFTLVLLGMIVCLLPIFIFKLKTRIDEKGIYYQFFPLHLKMRFIAWAEIESAHVRNYDPISEYGGWGIKGGSLWNKKNGTAVNISGDVGLQLELKTGKRLLIGTQKENEVKQVLKTYESQNE